MDLFVFSREYIINTQGPVPKGEKILFFIKKILNDSIKEINYIDNSVHIIGSGILFDTCRIYVNDNNNKKILKIKFTYGKRPIIRILISVLIVVLLIFFTCRSIIISLLVGLGLLILTIILINWMIRPILNKLSSKINNDLMYK